MGDEELEQLEETSSSIIKTIKQELKLHTVFLDEDIGEPKKYRELIHSLRCAEETETFQLLINSCGGSMFAAMAIVESIKESQARVQCVVMGECHSAASIIMMACDDIQITDSAHSLIHTASYGAVGNSNQIKTQVDFTTKQIQSLLRASYAGFLSEAEFIDLFKGVEFIFDADELRERLKNRVSPTP